MATISVNIKIDANLKEEADKLFSNFGLSFTSAVNAFLRQSVQERQPVFNTSLIAGRALTAKALADSEDDADIHGPFNTFDEMMADINADA